MLAEILNPKLDLEEFLSYVAQSAKRLDPATLQARVYEVDFIENFLYLRTSTQTNPGDLPTEDVIFQIRPSTITGDATIENRVIVASKSDGYENSRFVEGSSIRAAFPIEFYDQEMPEGRTKYVLVVDKTGDNGLSEDIVSALRDYSILAGLAISIKELRDKLSLYYEDNRNLVLTGKHSAAIGHDIRSLNTGVGGYLTLALKKVDAVRKKSQEKELNLAHKYMILAQDNARQAEALLKNFSHFNISDIILNRDTDLRDALVEKIESLINRIDFGRQIRFSLSVPEKPVGFKVDKDWFGTVVENLVRNSFEACGGATWIKVKLTRDSEKIHLFFEDDCGGIPDSIIRDIFTPFRTGKKAGQGLGLANAKKVVNDHGGVIFARSLPDRGAVFTMEFPLAKSGKDRK